MLKLFFVTTFCWIALTNGQQCTLLSNCPTYSWLKSRGSEFGFNVRRQLNRVHCGWDGPEQMVRCPSPTLVNGESVAEVIGSSRYSAAVMTSHRNQCFGSLTVLFASSRNAEFEPVVLNSIVEQNHFKRSGMPGLSPSHDAVYLRSDGNCCWIAYQRENRRGQMKNLQVGEDWRPTFQPKLFVKVDCLIP